MKTSLRASLEGKIEEWIISISEDHPVEEGLFDIRLAHCMAIAAAAVFDSSMDSQQFAKEEGWMK